MCNYYYRTLVTRVGYSRLSQKYRPLRRVVSKRRLYDPRPWWRVRGGETRAPCVTHICRLSSSARSRLVQARAFLRFELAIRRSACLARVGGFLVRMRGVRKLTRARSKSVRAMKRLAETRSVREVSVDRTVVRDASPPVTHWIVSRYVLVVVKSVYLYATKYVAGGATNAVFYVARKLEQPFVIRRCVHHSWRMRSTPLCRKSVIGRASADVTSNKDSRFLRPTENRPACFYRAEADSPEIAGGYAQAPTFNRSGPSRIITAHCARFASINEN